MAPKYRILAFPALVLFLGCGESSSGTHDASNNAGNDAQQLHDADPISSDAAPYDYEQSLLTTAQGYGKAVTGGESKPLITIGATEINDGTLFAAIEAGESWIRFEANLVATFTIGAKLRYGSNMTVDGRGADITFTVPTGSGVGVGFPEFTGTNLIMTNIMHDGYGLMDDPNAPPSPSNPGTAANTGTFLWAHNGASKLRIDHCSVNHVYDDPIVLNGVTDVEIAYCQNLNQHKFAILNDGTQFTFHHNNLDSALVNYASGGSGVGPVVDQIQRAPSTYNAAGDIYNNYFSGWGPNCVKAQGNSQLRVTDNYFDMGTQITEPLKTKRTGRFCETDNTLIDTRMPLRGQYDSATLSEADAFDCDAMSYDLPYASESQLMTAQLKNEIISKAGQQPNAEPEW